MNPAEYKKKIEHDLITEFVNRFHDKVGYYPTVITNHRITDDGIVTLTLPELEKYFEPFIPESIKKKGLGARDRYRNIVELRCIFFFIARSMKYNLKQLGDYMGGRDHTTVIHGINTFRNLYETDGSFRSKYYLIINHIKQDYEPSTLDPINQMECES
jgi:Bacterial dnaA protein helix-turn-helix